MRPLTLMSGSWVLITLSVLLGIVGGLGSVGLIGIINQALSSEVPAANLPWLFGGLALLVILVRISADLLITHLAQGLIYKLRLDLTRMILSASLSRLQKLGAPRLLATLTEDVASIAVAMEAVPWLCVSAAIVLGCMVYMGFLAWPLLLLVLGAMIVGVAIFLTAKSRALEAMQSARHCQDEIFTHFRGLTEGIKELKLNRARRNAFFSEGLEVSAAAYRDYSIAGQRLYILAGNISNSLLFVTIGVILFALPTCLVLWSYG